jgi:thiamine-phosphate diphosphorylase
MRRSLASDDSASASSRAVVRFASVTASEADARASGTREPPHEPGERVPIVHAVTNDEIVLRPDFLDRARRVMHAGGPRVAVHVRAPRLGGRDLYELACKVAKLQSETRAWAVVNDRADIALASLARGVQLTSRSITPADAARFARDLWIGASIHSPADARAAADGGAHWLVVGHPVEDRERGEADRGTAFIERIAADHALPVIAIGGVRPEHVPALQAAGAYGVAVIRGVWNANDAGAAVIDYLSAHGTAGGRQ